nr:polymorphic toxin type 15 domain-containing protein [Pseudomonas sp.]
MSVLAALHNPDLMAGGRDIVSDFGDRQVNSTIGPQWKSKLPNLKKAAKKIPLEFRSTTRMNTRLHKCW